MPSSRGTRRLYDVEEYAARARAALVKLQETQKPGEGKTGTKSDVLHAVIDEIKALRSQGYTSLQIADAMRQGDVFGILPKSITALLEDTKTRKKAKGQSPKPPPQPKQPPQPARPAIVPPAKRGSVAVQPDTDDL
jgi:hypothetical protein